MLTSLLMVVCETVLFERLPCRIIFSALRFFAVVLDAIIINHCQQFITKERCQRVQVPLAYLAFVFRCPVAERQTSRRALGFERVEIDLGFVLVQVVL